ncbi:hypothetical protein TYRP_020251 [Tyrophagus putrescentiae]|nr:hypothetical protein TYRP_020251 [Tyrophagus putrescentiae]
MSSDSLINTLRNYQSTSTAAWPPPDSNQAGKEDEASKAKEKGKGLKRGRPPADRKYKCRRCKPAQPSFKENELKELILEHLQDQAAGKSGDSQDEIALYGAMATGLTAEVKKVIQSFPADCSFYEVERR